jgi:hypothetical protein
MAGETLRTEAYLLGTSLADNTTGEISPLDVRDGIYSLYRRIEAALSGADAEYGELYWSTPAATALNVGVWAKASGTTTLALSNDFTMPANNRLRHDGPETEIYRVACDFTITAGANNQVVWVGLSRNGDPPDVASQRYRLIATGSDAGMGSTQGLFSLAATDYVELWVMNATGSNTVTIQRACMTAVKVI